MDLGQGEVVTRRGPVRGGQKGFRRLMRGRPMGQRPLSLLSPYQRSTRETALRVLRRSRRFEEPLSKAAREAHTSPETVRRYLGGRSVLVKRSSLVGLGKEGTKLAARLKLRRIAGETPSVFVDWKRRLLGMGRVEARRLGLPWRAVTRWKSSLRKRRVLRRDALGRLRTALVGS